MIPAALPRTLLTHETIDADAEPPRDPAGRRRPARSGPPRRGGRRSVRRRSHQAGAAGHHGRTLGRTSPLHDLERHAARRQGARLRLRLWRDPAAGPRRGEAAGHPRRLHHPPPPRPQHRTGDADLLRLVRRPRDAAEPLRAAAAQADHRRLPEGAEAGCGRLAGGSRPQADRIRPRARGLHRGTRDVGAGPEGRRGRREPSAGGPFARLPFRLSGPVHRLLRRHHADGDAGSPSQGRGRAGPRGHVPAGDDGGACGGRAAPPEVRPSPATATSSGLT